MQRISWLKGRLVATMLQEDDACQHEALSSRGIGDHEVIQDQVKFVMSGHVRQLQAAARSASVIEAALTARMLLNVEARNVPRVSWRLPALALMQM